MARLTQAKIRGLTEKPGRHSDGQGLYLRSLGDGKSYWAYRYRSPDPEAKGHEREVSIGPYPEIALVEARLRHAALRKQVIVDKVDPLAEKAAAKAAAAPKPAKPTKPTFGETANRYLARKQERGQLGKNPVHRAQWRSTLASLPAWFRALPVDEIGPRQVFDALDPIWAKTPETASRLRGRIAAVIDDAREPDDVRANPAAWSGWLKTKLGDPRALGKIDRKTGKRVARSGHAAMPAKDIPAFVARLKETPGASAMALRFLILTAARTSEVIGMPFDEIKLNYEVLIDEKRTATIPAWLIPKERMKMDVGHRVPLGEAAAAIIKEQIEARGPEQVFVFESPNRASAKVQPLSNMAMMMTMRRLGAGAYTPHGFRSTFHQWATEIAKADLAIVEACLAHKVGTKVTRAYDRSDRFVLRQPLMARWSAFLTGEPASVIPLRRA